MTTKAEVMAALAMSPRARVSLNLREVDSLRAYIRHALETESFTAGAILDFPAFAEDAGAAGFYTDADGSDDNVAAAVLLEGLLLVSTRGTRALFMMWPDSTSRGWRRDAEARRTKIQRIAERGA